MSQTPPIPTIRCASVTVHDGSILVVTLNRESKRNALDPPSSAELYDLWTYFEQNNQLRVAILTGKGKSFCAGFDLDWFNKNPNSPPGPAGRTETREDIGFGGLTSRRLSKPIIAAVNGGAHGGGFELALACDIIIASPEAKFQLPEVKVGIAAVAGGLARLPRFVGYHRAASIALTARLVDVKEAYSMGLVTEIVDGPNLLPHAIKLAKQILEGSPDAILFSKKVLQMSIEGNSTIHSVMEQQHKIPEYAHMMMGDNRIEGVRAFTEKRKPNWKLSAKL